MRPSDARTDDLPAGLPAMWRVLKLGVRSEPTLLGASLAMTLFQALPDALVALWLALLTDGVLDPSRTKLLIGAFGLAASATLLWALQVTLSRTIRRLGDRLNIMFQGHVATLQARIPTIEHHERPELLDRIAVLRMGVFALDHLFASMFTMAGWVIRLAVVTALLMSIHPALGLLVLAAAPSWRSRCGGPGSKRRWRNGSRRTAGWPATCSSRRPPHRRARRSG